MPEIPRECPKCGKVGYWHREVQEVGDEDYPDEIHVWFVCETGLSTSDVYERMAASVHGSESKADPICGHETEKVIYKPH